MAMMTPAAFVAHVDHEIARKFANDILDLLGTAEAKAEAKPKPKPKAKPEEEIEEEEE